MMSLYEVTLLIEVEEGDLVEVTDLMEAAVYAVCGCGGDADRECVRGVTASATGIPIGLDHEVE